MCSVQPFLKTHAGKRTTESAMETTSTGQLRYPNSGLGLPRSVPLRPPEGAKELSADLLSQRPSVCNPHSPLVPRTPTSPSVSGPQLGQRTLTGTTHNEADGPDTQNLYSCGLAVGKGTVALKVQARIGIADG